MDAAALVGLFRQRADDVAEPHLFATDWLLGIFSEAEKEACLRARLIWDEGLIGSTFLNVALDAGKDSYALDTHIDRIDRVTFVPTGQGLERRALELTGADAIADRRRCRNAAGRPEMVAQQGQTLQVWPVPSADYPGTLRISCYRFPLFPMEDGSDEPEIPEEHHEGLVDWALYRAWSSKDSENDDPARAMAALAAFEERFGRRPSADVLRRHRERRRVTTRFNRL